MWRRLKSWTSWFPITALEPRSATCCNGTRSNAFWRKKKCKRSLMFGQCETAVDFKPGSIPERKDKVTMRSIALLVPTCLLVVGSIGLYSQTAQDQSQLNAGLASLPLLSHAESRMVFPENPTGEKGNGGKAIPNPADPDLYYSK